MLNERAFAKNSLLFVLWCVQNVRIGFPSIEYIIYLYKVERREYFSLNLFLEVEESLVTLALSKKRK